MAGEIDEIHGQRKGRHVLGPSHRCGRNSHCFREITFRVCHVEPRITKQPSQQEGSYQTASKETMDVKQFLLHACLPEQNPDKKLKAHMQLKPHPRWTWTARRRATSSSTPQQLRYLLQTHLPEYIKKLIHLRGHGRNLRPDSRRSGAHVTSKSMSVTAPWKSQGKYHARETLCADPTTNPTIKWQLIPSWETLELQRRGNFEGVEKTSSKFQCQYCNMDNVRGTTFDACSPEWIFLLSLFGAPFVATLCTDVMGLQYVNCRADEWLFFSRWRTRQLLQRSCCLPSGMGCNTKERNVMGDFVQAWV